MVTDDLRLAINLMCHEFCNELVDIDYRYDAIFSRLSILYYWDVDVWARGHEWLEALHKAYAQDA